MSTKDTLLSLLESRKGEFLSGEEIAGTLQISRTAVWKAINSLRSAGYEIEAVQNRGYCLSNRSDFLSEQGIHKYLKPSDIALHLNVYAVTDSTNAQLRQLANAGAEEGCAIIANAQTGGRGRLGRSFYSPPDTGIYLSLLLRPQNFKPEQAVRITTMAAVAAAEAIEEVSGREVAIKWVNDIFVGGKKVCGILTEGAFNVESGSLDYIVLGVGINAYEPQGGFPEDISNVAGAVFEGACSDGKNRLTAAFLNHFLEIYTAGQDTYTQRYRSRSMVIGKAIYVISPSGKRAAVALDVDRECRLVVRYEDGSIAPLSSGEVSIRPI